MAEWSVLGLTALALLSLGWSTYRPIEAPATIVHQAAAVPVTSLLQAQAPEEIQKDFDQPRDHPAPSPLQGEGRGEGVATPTQQVAASVISAERITKTSPVVAGRFLSLNPTTPLTVPATGRLEFVATLNNSQPHDWRVVGELIVVKSDGTTETLLRPRVITIRGNQRLQIPAGFSAKRFPLGSTQFIAILRDQSGQEIDRATLTFTIEPAR